MTLQERTGLATLAEAEVPCPERHPGHGSACICVYHTEGDHRDEHGCTWPNTATLPSLGPCTRNPEHGPAEVPWAGDRLCWDCADHELDLLALALQSEDGWPVQVGSGHPGHRQELSTEDHRVPSQDDLVAALADDLLALADGSLRRVDRIIELLERGETWEGGTR